MRYQTYKSRISEVLADIAARESLRLDADSTARQLIAMIDGLWLEYCLHYEEFTLTEARADCYRLLRGQGISLEDDNQGSTEKPQ